MMQRKKKKIRTARDVIFVLLIFTGEVQDQ